MIIISLGGIILQEHSNPIFPLVSGPPLPQRLHYGVGVPYLDTLLVVGGHDGRRATDRVYRYDRETHNVPTWVLLPQRLSTPAHYHAAFAVNIHEQPKWT